MGINSESNAIEGDRKNKESNNERIHVEHIYAQRIWMCMRAYHLYIETNSHVYVCQIPIFSIL